ncbi:MAG: carboxypeptidase-like regulatory domain-containing protein [Bacteroidota bacterium]
MDMEKTWKLNARSCAIARWLVLAVVIGLTGCQDEGFGGTRTLTGVVNHHGLPIPDALVGIKFDATELPGTAIEIFDAQVTSDANGVYTFEDLHKGDYYLYSIGYDSAISEAVLGGLYVKVSGGQTTTQDLPVTE